MVAEAEAIAVAMGFRLDIDMDRVVATNSQLAHRPSILQDLEAGRPMEIDALYSVPLDMARPRAWWSLCTHSRPAGLGDDQSKGTGSRPLFRLSVPDQNAIQANIYSVLLSLALRPNPS